MPAAAFDREWSCLVEVSKQELDQIGFSEPGSSEHKGSPGHEVLHPEARQHFWRLNDHPRGGLETVVPATVDELPQSEEAQFGTGDVVPGDLPQNLVRKECDWASYVWKPPVRRNEDQFLTYLTEHTKHSYAHAILQVLVPQVLRNLSPFRQRSQRKVIAGTGGQSALSVQLRDPPEDGFCFALKLN